jgi:hypothetical protein
MYISEWICETATGNYQQLVPLGEYTPRDMAFLHVYQNGIYTMPHYYQQLVHEIYTQGHGILMYISEWDLHGAATSYYQQLVPGRNIHPGTWHSSMYISEWDLWCSTSYQQLVQGEIYTQGHGIPPCI